MLGQIVYARGRVGMEQESLLGMTVLRVTMDPESFWHRRSVKRCARMLVNQGVRRVLAPEGFEHWERLEGYGLRRVDPASFLQAHAAPLAIAALKRCGRDPGKCAVALRGARADCHLVWAAKQLCPQVRDVCISVNRGGEALKNYLRWEYGVAVRPDFPTVPVALRHSADSWERGGCVLDLYGPEYGLAGGGVVLPALSKEEQGQLSLLAALWECGKVAESDLEFT